MPESLIVHKTHVDVNFELSTIGAAVHSLIAIIVVALGQKFSAEIIHNIVVFISLESLVFE